MNKVKAMLSFLALAAALMLGMTVPAFAEGEPVIKKTLEVNPGAPTLYNINIRMPQRIGPFKFSIEPITLQTNISGVTTSTDAPLPNISSITVDSTHLTGSSTVIFGNWPHAGIYAWKVTEIPGTTDGMYYDPQVYTLIADVKNAAQGDDYIVNYIIVKGLATSTENNDGDKVTSMDFTNKYAPYAQEGLFVKKEVTSGGDTAKQFEFTITFTAPPVLPPNKTAADYLNEIGVVTDGGATVTQQDLATPGATTREYKFTAAHEEEIIFINLLYGTTWSISETPVAGYTQQWEARCGGRVYHNTNDILFQEGDFSGNAGTMTNKYDVAPPTALLLNNLPFILLGLLAVAGLVVYGTAKKRLTN